MVGLIAHAMPTFVSICLIIPYIIVNFNVIFKTTLHYNGYNWNSVFDVETIDELLQMIDKKYENDTKGNTRQRYYNKNGTIELQTREHGSKIQPNKFKGYTIYKHGIHITISKGGAHGAIRGIYDLSLIHI